MKGERYKKYCCGTNFQFHPQEFVQIIVLAVVWDCEFVVNVFLFSYCKIGNNYEYMMSEWEDLRIFCKLIQ